MDWKILVGIVLVGIVWWAVSSDDAPDVPLTPPGIKPWPPEDDTFKE